MYPVAPPRKTKKDAGLPALTREEVESRLQLLCPRQMPRVRGLLEEVAHDDFWRRDRFVQVVRMLDAKDEYDVTQVDIGVVLHVSKGLVSRYKKYHQYNPVESRPRSGPKSVLDEVFPQIQFFIDGKNSEGEAVTMGVLLGYIVDELKVPVSRNTLYTYMRRHFFAYEPALTRDVHRVDINPNEVVAFYDDLERDLAGVNSRLVYNVDESGFELFADKRNEVMV